MNKLTIVQCNENLEHLEDDFEASHNFVAQVFATCILFFLLAYNENIMIFGKNYKFHKKNMFFISIIFSIICILLSIQYFIVYFNQYNKLNNICNFNKLFPGTNFFRYQIPLIVSFCFIIISISLSVMIFTNIFS